MDQCLEVGAAVIFADFRLLLATRKPGSTWDGKWEFPGGKQKVGETLNDCIQRELLEELNLQVKYASLLFQYTYFYPNLNVRLHFMLCNLQKPACPIGLEGQQVDWFASSQLADLDWVPADAQLLQDLTQLHSNGRAATAQQSSIKTEKLRIVDADNCRRFVCWLQGQACFPEIEQKAARS